MKYWLLLPAFFTLIVSSCGNATTSKPASKDSKSVDHPTAIIPVSAGALSMTPPLANGEVFVLAGNSSSKGVFGYELASGKEIASFSVSNAADAITAFPSGLLAIAIAAGNTGAIDLYSDSGTKVATVPIAAPALSLTAGSDGATVYVLQGNSTVKSVVILDTTTDTATRTIPVDANTVAVVPSLHEHELYGVESNGFVAVYALSTGQKIGSFTVGHSGIAGVMSPDGTTLYVLKGHLGVYNVAVVNLATQSDLRALPAPAGAVGIQVTPDGTELIELASIVLAAVLF